MKNLDDFSKKHPFTVPDDYFDQLPGKIQERVQGTTSGYKFAWVPVMRYAMAMLVVAAVAFIWFWNTPEAQKAQSPESILASLETADLVAYLKEGDITTDELLDGVRLNNEDATEIEGAVFDIDLDDSDLNSLMNEID